MACNGVGMKVLRGTELRYVLTRLIQLLGPITIPQLLVQLADWGFAAEGRPSKTVSDALRWEIGRGRVYRCGRGTYREAWAPRGTEYRIIARVAALREEAESLRGGHKVS